ncbi:MAG: metabolite traffic protein EboE [Planctomycetota bacterium]|nr:metabolite traffic protein EboE [Planctomycetota bacterium]
MTEQTGTRTVGYCTNVHAGATLEDVCAKLQQHVPVIRQYLGDQGPLPIGLWLSRHALDDILVNGVAQLNHTLDHMGAAVFTLNGFPYGNFHESEVKHRVYAPDWSKSERLIYTIELARVLNLLVPPDTTAGISTLPVCWSNPSAKVLEAAAANLRTAASSLAAIEARTGTCLHVDLEPEPGCLLQRSQDVVDFFENHLLTVADEHIIRRHLRVCHDVCHAAVMFEPQADAIATYDAAGIAIGKVQVSSALQADGGEPRQLEELSTFSEPRWLHQVCIRSNDQVSFYEDLPNALEGHEPDGGCWRIHFHVPVHQATLGSLSTTQPDLADAIDLLASRDDITDWEVETYAWNAMPGFQGEHELAKGIAEEIRWTRQRLGDAS